MHEHSASDSIFGSHYLDLVFTAGFIRLAYQPPVLALLVIGISETYLYLRGNTLA